MISDLRNLGPKSREMLILAGVGTVEQLRQLGAARAYVQVKRKSRRASLNLLWALEGALTDRAWQDVAREDRLRLLLEVEALENADAGSGAREDAG